MQSPDVILIDGTGYLFRAFYALPPLTNSNGQPTGALFGMHNMLRKLERLYPDSKCIVVFDAPGPTFRDALFSDYKANRESTPSELRSQIDPVQKMVTAMGLPMLIKKNVEADDVLGTLAKQGAESELDVLICTADKDMAQLVNERVHLLDEKKDRTLDRQAVFEQFAVWPEQIIDYLTLAGDSADNIPGVPKVGPKTAAKWLDAYKSLDGIVQHQDEISGVVGENLRAVIADGGLTLSQKLATIDCHVDLDTTLAALRPQAPDLEVLQEIYEYIGSKRLLTEFRASGSLFNKQSTKSTTTDTETTYTLLRSEQLPEWQERLHQAGTFACHALAQKGFSTQQSHLVGIALAHEAGVACYLPINHSDLSDGEQVQGAVLVAFLRSLFEEPAHRIICAGAKQLLHLLNAYNIRCRAALEDVDLLCYVLQGAGTNYHLEAQAMLRLGASLMTEVQLLGKGREKVALPQCRPEAAVAFTAARADCALQLYESRLPELTKSASQKAIFYDLEMPLLFVLWAMECHGARIDPEILRAQSALQAKRLDVLQARIWEISGHQFNISSTKQLQAVLFEEQGLPITKKTPKGAASTDESVLAQLAQNYELPELIITHRSLTKLKTTYLDKLPEEINPSSGRIHTSFHQMAASTGRLSSVNPNLQNIPIRTEEGRKVREAFIPEAGKVLLSADYSQIELRIMAHISEDEGLLEAFRLRQDIHRTTAAEIFAIPLDEVSDTQRREAKAINFGLIYGMGAYGLSQQLKISQIEANNYIHSYFERYPGVKQYMDTVLKGAHERGYVETLWGRRVFLPRLKSGKGAMRRAAERAAINAPIQGTAADIIKRAMIRIHAWLGEETGLDSVAMILQVHDELVFEVRPEQQPKLEAGLHQYMSEAASLKVPLEVNIGRGANWMEAH